MSRQKRSKIDTLILWGFVFFITGCFAGSLIVNRNLRMLGVLFLLMWSPLVVLLHALSHVCTAKILGVKALILLLGRGKRIRRFSFKFNELIIDARISWFPFGAFYEGHAPRRAQKIALALSGFVPSTLLILLLCAVVGLNSLISLQNDLIGLVWQALAGSCLLDLFASLLPLSDRRSNGEALFYALTEKAPDSPMISKGKTLLAQKKFDEARAYFEELLVREPANSALILGSAQALRGQGFATEALCELQALTQHRDSKIRRAAQKALAAYKANGVLDKS